MSLSLDGLDVTSLALAARSGLLDLEGLSAVLERVEGSGAFRILRHPGLLRLGEDALGGAGFDTQEEALEALTLLGIFYNELEQVRTLRGLLEERKRDDLIARIEESGLRRWVSLAALLTESEDPPLMDAAEWDALEVAVFTVLERLRGEVAKRFARDGLAQLANPVRHQLLQPELYAEAAERCRAALAQESPGDLDWLPPIGEVGLALQRTDYGVSYRLPKGAVPKPLADLQEAELFRDCARSLAQVYHQSYPQPPLWRREFEPGEIICREGEQGQTAFYIISGTVEIYIAALLERPPVERGLWARTRDRLFGSAPARRSPRRETIPTDGPVDLSMQEPHDLIEPGHIFGEQAALTRIPRSATVRARDRVVCFEMTRPVIDKVLGKSSSFKEYRERTYRRYALRNHLRSIELFREVSKDLRERFFERLQEHAELETIRKTGAAVFRQGDTADSFYIVRSGFVKFVREGPGGSTVLSYGGRGTAFGELGLFAVSEDERLRTLGEAERSRTASCLTLYKFTELVRFPYAALLELLRDFPEIEGYLKELMSERLERDRALREAAPAKLPDLNILEQNLYIGQNLFLIDLDKCTRCDECVQACADSHDGYSRFARDGLRFDKYLVTGACRACVDPLCMARCPVGSIHRLGGEASIRIEDWCIGCGICANDCPYGSIEMRPYTKRELKMLDQRTAGRSAAYDDARGRFKPFKAEVCDLCADVGGQPYCAYACPHDAAFRISPRGLTEL